MRYGVPSHIKALHIIPSILYHFGNPPAAIIEQKISSEPIRLAYFRTISMLFLLLLEGARSTYLSSSEHVWDMIYLRI
ncbi:hypothetical protein CEXT_78851 [Caerostris extrusa]|uniref:Uncharacterized protein n=1 Tax=Caerostris extrusa TaxID=172846 RepID=A0AAV4N664_CAEEX|nr:hypothetical protein CEXT_78851 [Caerostris extrusa]